MLPGLPTRIVLQLSILALAGSPLAAQSVTGRVTGDGEPLAGVRIVAGEPGAPFGAVVSRDDGRYLLTGLPTGSVRVTFRAIGYEPHDETVTVPGSGSLRLDVELRGRAVELDPIVVTGTLSETRVSDSPVKVEVVSRRLLERNASRSLMDAVGRVNGLSEQVDCGVCYTNSIRINGMDGPYTAVLIDGMPIMGALASVYGLEGIDPALIEQIEILKGPQSTLYGTEAMGGVINVITRDPRFAPLWSVDLSTSDLGQHATRVSWAPSGDRLDGLLSASIQHNDRFIDRNGDRFSDLTLDTRVALFAKASLRDREVERLGITAKFYHEDRFGGVEEWTKADRGRRTVYGESIETRRAEVMLRARLPWEHTRLSGSFSWHDQDSYYGDQAFLARQAIGFGQLLWDPPKRGDLDLLAGATARWQRYDDQTPATPTADRRFIPGVLLEATWYPGFDLALLGGTRVDHQGDHGLIFAPRLTAKWSADPLTTLRASWGTGFRIVNLFTEDHAALTGAREVVIHEGLEPERSRSFALNLNRVFEFGVNNMMLDLDLFHTRFSNKIEPDYDQDPNRIVYANLDGEAVSRGVALSVNQNFGDTPLDYSVGVTVQDVFRSSATGVREAAFHAPEFTGNWSLSWTFEQLLSGLDVTWGGIVVGPMRMPKYDPPFERPTRSESWVRHDLELRLDLGGGRELYLGGENLTDFRQPSPLIDPGNPFGDDFDTSYNWGPVVGRRLFAGVRVGAGR